MKIEITPIGKEQETETNRREFLGKTTKITIGAAGLAGAALYFSEAWRSPETEIDKQVKNFPREIPGAATVHITPHRGSWGVVVHLKELPMQGLLTQFPDLQDTVTAVNADHAQILDFLAKKKNIHAIYPAGITDQKRDALPADLQNEVRRKSLRTFLGAAYEPIENGTMQLHTSTRQEDIDKMITLIREQLKTQPIEQVIIMLKYLEENEYYSSRNPDLIALRKRQEDFLLQRIVKNGHTKSIVKRSLFNRLGDNVEERNKQHPDRILSLIEIKPTTLFVLEKLAEQKIG